MEHWNLSINIDKCVLIVFLLQHLQHCNTTQKGIGFRRLDFASYEKSSLSVSSLNRVRNLVTSA